MQRLRRNVTDAPHTLHTYNIHTAAHQSAVTLEHPPSPPTRHPSNTQGQSGGYIQDARGACMHQPEAHVSKSSTSAVCTVAMSMKNRLAPKVLTNTQCCDTPALHTAMQSKHVTNLPLSPEHHPPVCQRCGTAPVHMHTQYCNSSFTQHMHMGLSTQYQGMDSTMC